jgi:hypothetical protein|tara:strand:- start:457 stop:648 length:192 start_codon:yes stop_codon:yes gene_type:complete
MQVGDLVRNKRHPQAGVGVVVEVSSGRVPYEEDIEYAIAVFPSCDVAQNIIYPDEVEVVSESR